MTKLLTIVIPTYKRREAVCEQIRQLNQFIVDSGLQDKIAVIASDNHSEDGTYEALLEMEKLVSIDYEARTQPENLGGTYNSRAVLKTVDSPYAMFLGDDDYLDPQYLSTIVGYLENHPEITAIFPNFYSNRSPKCRDTITEDKIYKKGVQSLPLMFKAHQMSGLVFKLDNVLDTLFAKNGENRYYQVYCMGFNMLRGDALHLTRLPLCVNETNTKYGGYGNDGLWDHMFMNTRLLEITPKERRWLERYYLLNCSWSAIPRLLKHPIQFTNAIIHLENLTVSSKWLALPCMFISGCKIVYQKKIKKVG